MNQHTGIKEIRETGLCNSINHNPPPPGRLSYNILSPSSISHDRHSGLMFSALDYGVWIETWS